MPMIGVGNFAPDRLDEIRNGIDALHRVAPGGDVAAALAEKLEAQIVQIAEEVDRGHSGMDDRDAFEILNSIGFGAERISVFHFVLPKPKGSRHGTKVEVRIHDYGPSEKRRFFVEAFSMQAIGDHPPGDRLGYGRGATLREAIDLIAWPDPDESNTASD